MSEVTKLMPVTARFDGCFCSERCGYLCIKKDMFGWSIPCCAISTNDNSIISDVNTATIGKVFLDYRLEDGSLCFSGGRNTKTLINMDALLYANIRTRWCCETFGMGDEG